MTGFGTEWQLRPPLARQASDCRTATHRESAPLGSPAFPISLTPRRPEATGMNVPLAPPMDLLRLCFHPPNASIAHWSFKCLPSISCVHAPDPTGG